MSRNSKKINKKFGQLSYYFLGWNLANLIILAENFCLRFNAPFLEVAVLSPYLKVFGYIQFLKNTICLNRTKPLQIIN